MTHVRPRHGRAGVPEDAGWFRTKWSPAPGAPAARRRRASRRCRCRGGSCAASLVFGTWVLGAIAALMVVAIVLFYTLTDVPRPESLPLPQVATIEYADGSTLAKIGTVDRTIVPLSKVPAHVRWAVLAAEDRSFYSESVVSIKGTVRAALSDVTGGNTQGGSGITQQYVKNAYLSSSQTLSRKLKELMIAIKLSREYSKDQILEFYLNTVYFGRNTYGIEAASEAFFGVPVQKLNVAQGAVLAGLLRAPGYYDPATNPSAAKQRWRYVLDGMVKTGHLTQAQEDSLAFPKAKPIHGNGIGVTGWKFLIKQRGHGRAVGATASAPTRSRNAGCRSAPPSTPRPRRRAVSAVTTEFAHLTKKQKQPQARARGGRPVDRRRCSPTTAAPAPDVKGHDGKVDYNDYASQRRPPAGLVVQALRARHRADADAAAGRGQAALRDRQQGRRQLLPDHRGHQDLQRPGRPVGQRLARQDRQRDEVLAEHHLRPARPPRPGRTTSPTPRTRWASPSVDSNGAQDAAGQERLDQLRHRHRRLPGVRDRPGQRVRDARRQGRAAQPVPGAVGDGLGRRDAVQALDQVRPRPSTSGSPTT